MKFVLEIRCDNAAFGKSAMEAESEVSSILSTLCVRVREGELRNKLGRTHYRTILDLNGNAVGHATFIYEAPEDRRE